MLQAWHTCIWGVSPILCQVGSVAAQLFSGLSRDVRSGSNPGSGWATQGHSETCPEATPVFPPDLMLGIQAKQSNIGSIRPENL
jgi:hypothetical protein